MKKLTLEGYNVHEIKTKQLLSDLSFATTIISELKVFIDVEGKKKSELHILLSEANLNSEKRIASKNSALAHRVIEAITQLGWINFRQQGALLLFEPGTSISF